jgi:hypothetical protein
MRWLVPPLLVAIVAAAVAAERVPSRPPPAPALRYPDVAPIFDKHCAGCHDARRGPNPKPQAIFEMSKGYPFTTARPARLLGDLRHMFETRGSLSAEEKQRGVRWIDDGALDERGEPPGWR